MNQQDDNFEIASASNRRETGASNLPLFRIVLGVCLIGMAIGTTYGALILIGFKKWETRGQFGDSLGGLNAFFSGLALIGVIIAVYLQNRELRLQRMELKSSRKQLARTAYAQEKSDSALREQAQALRQATAYQAYSNLRNTYEAGHMETSVANLWAFYESNGDDGVAERYREVVLISQGQANLVPSARSVEGDEARLINDRRIVAQFYQRMANLYVGGFIPSRILFSQWQEADLRIIQRILVPGEDGKES